MKNLCFVAIVVLPLALGGCAGAGIVAGLGAKAGIAASQEGGLDGAWEDTRIQAAINDLWFRRDVEMFRKLDLTVTQGRVLITGVVQNPEHRVEAVRLAWQPEGVKQVINEIRVADDPGITRYARDAWISTRLRTALTFDRIVQSINYNIDTVDGVIYLMGVAQNQTELNRVVEIARGIPDVKQVVSYVKMAGEGKPGFSPVRDNAAAGAPGAQAQNPDFYDAPPATPAPVGAVTPGLAVPAPVQTETLGAPVPLTASPPSTMPPGGGY